MVLDENDPQPMTIDKIEPQGSGGSSLTWDISHKAIHPSKTIAVDVKMSEWWWLFVRYELLSPQPVLQDRLDVRIPWAMVVPFSTVLNAYSMIIPRVGFSRIIWHWVSNSIHQRGSLDTLL